MSTVTKIKGVIDNYSLPVITPEGLQPYWQGVFVNKLAEKNYTLSTRQKDAVSTFLSEIAKDDVINAVRYLWPFIGDNVTPDAAKVPLIGNKDFDFGDSFTDISYNANNEIIGLTDIPAIASLNTMDFCDDKCVNIASSQIVKSLSSVASPSNKGCYPVVLESNVLQFRAIQYAENRYYEGVYTPATTFTTVALPENMDDGGNYYVMFGFNNHSTTPYYNRYAKINNDAAVRAASSDTTRTYTPPTSEQAEKTLISPISAQKAFLTAITGLAVFNRILSVSELDIFMNAWKKMNIALGKEVSV